MFLLWLTYALLTPFFWAVNNVLDRLMMVRLVKNEYALTMAAVFSRLPAFFLFWALTDWYVPTPREFFFALIAGFLVIVPILFYFKAMERDEPSRVILLYDATNPLFVLVMSLVLLGERLNIPEGIGFAILLFAGILASLRRSEQSERSLVSAYRISRAALWILLASFLWAGADIFLGYLVPKFPSILSLLTWEFLGSFLGGLIFFCFSSFRQRSRLQDFHWSKTAWGIFALETVTVFAGYYTFLKAFELERVSLTVVVTNIQPLFVFLFGIMLAKRSSLFERVDMSFQNIFPKVFAFLLVIVGILLLQS